MLFRTSITLVSPDGCKACAVSQIPLASRDATAVAEKTCTLRRLVDTFILYRVICVLNSALLCTLCPFITVSSDSFDMLLFMDAGWIIVSVAFCVV